MKRTLLAVMLCLAPLAGMAEDVEYEIEVSNDRLQLNSVVMGSVRELAERLSNLPQDILVAVLVYPCTRYEKLDEVMEVLRRKRLREPVSLTVVDASDDSVCQEGAP